MMMKLTAAALAMCCSFAMACPGTCSSAEAKAGAGEAKVQTVANESECALHCSGAQAAVQTVAMETKPECPLGCDGSKGEATSAAMTKVAHAAPEGEACDKAACAAGDKSCSGTCNKPCKLACSAPAITYKVGDETTTCPETAKTMAAEHHADVRYVVAGAEYADAAQAKAAHLAAMEQYVGSLTRVAYNVGGECMDCPMSAKTACEKSGKAMQYQVGPMIFETEDQAKQAAAAARAALEQVAMTYEVEGQLTQCSVEAKTMAESCASKSMTYVVNGQKTQCEETAKYMLTEAKMQAAIGAIQKAMS